jgi:DNA-binding MurR/RpiR family transcriptional regulator
MRVLSTINGLFPSLTKSEQKIAQYILTNSSEIELLSIGELASKADAAESTVIRFCRKIGYKGYQAFKIALTRDLAANHSDHERSKSFTEKLIKQYENCLVNTADLLNATDFQNVVKLLDKASHICILGVGYSEIVGKYLKAQLIRLGKVVSFDQDAHFQAINSAMLHDGDVVVAISQSGNTKDVLKNVQIARQHKVSIICITNFIHSKLVSSSDFVLTAASNLDVESTFLPMLGQFFVIDLLCAKLMERHPAELKQFRSLINKALIDRL